ncbi:uncharacterized protein LOC131953135 [Physella acuta]|uniref:uncharacterized protein LOC131953135 n=1 Tax=Physella acuta TaxID=109671 RepID=UPI0027DE425E|nr:uncharacterized protein LOC131953135 [Physella acuta]
MTLARMPEKQRPSTASTMCLVLKPRQEDYRYVCHLSGSENERAAYRKNRVIQMRLSTYLAEVCLQEKSSARLFKTAEHRFLQEAAKRSTIPRSAIMLQQLRHSSTRPAPTLPHLLANDVTTKNQTNGFRDTAEHVTSFDQSASSFSPNENYTSYVMRRSTPVLIASAVRRRGLAKDEMSERDDSPTPFYTSRPHSVLQPIRPSQPLGEVGQSTVAGDGAVGDQRPEDSTAIQPDIAPTDGAVSAKQCTPSTAEHTSSTCEHTTSHTPDYTIKVYESGTLHKEFPQRQLTLIQSKSNRPLNDNQYPDVLSGNYNVIQTEDDIEYLETALNFDLELNEIAQDDFVEKRESQNPKESPYIEGKATIHSKHVSRPKLKYVHAPLAPLRHNITSVLRQERSKYEASQLRIQQYLHNMPPMDR